MARALRLEYSGALYHVTSRGDRHNVNKDIHFLKRSFIFSESVFYVVSCWCYFDLISKK